ncbi:type I restriction enzyme HsdR N-terminal domain-containing protein [Kordia sp.]|uniref:type I restriction enzyme HsdR N-terminal domain-containing protein n=1 Tax=Kordia sp. TaxID=1965332 RepID=UPI003B5CF1CF
MELLNFPKYTFRFKNRENKIYIFDAIRKKFVVLTPEEWVRQHTVQFLIQEKNYPISLINVEKELIFNDLKRRYDIVIFNPNGSIFLVVECKRSKVMIKQDTFDQIARYNMVLKAQYLMVTNGLNHYYCTMDYEAEQYQFLRELPTYKR